MVNEELRAALERIAEVLDQSGGDRYAIEARGIARAALAATAPQGTWCREHSTFDLCPETCPRGGGYWHGESDCRYAGRGCTW